MSSLVYLVTDDDLFIVYLTQQKAFFTAFEAILSSS